MAQPQSLTYGLDINVETNSVTPVELMDVSSWHRVAITVPVTDMNDIFHWTRRNGTYDASANRVDYWRYTAMLIRSFWNFVDIDTPTEPVLDANGDPIDNNGDGTEDRRYTEGLSFTTPPWVAPTDLENPTPTINSSQLLPNTFNTLLLRWVLWSLYGTSRPAPGTVVGLTDIYELLTNFMAARGIAKSFWENTRKMALMLSALKTNAQDRYFDLNDSNPVDGSYGIISGYEGLVDTEKWNNDEVSGKWGWIVGDILELPMRISNLPNFNGQSVGPVTLRLQLVMSDTVPSWRTPYSSLANAQTVSTVIPEYAEIDAAISTIQGAFADTPYNTFASASGVVNDISANLYVYEEARALRDYFLWLSAGGGIPVSVTDANINVYDASANMHIAYSDLLSTIPTTAEYLPFDIADVSGILTRIADASANVLTLQAARDRYLELLAFVPGGGPPDAGRIGDVSAGIVALDDTAAAYTAEAAGYATRYNQVFNEDTLDVEHAALRWWAASAYSKQDANGWTDISENGEFLTPGAGPEYGVTNPLYALNASNNVLPTIDVSPYLDYKRQKEYNAVVADLNATNSLLVLARLGTNTAYIQELEAARDGLIAKRDELVPKVVAATLARQELAETSLVKLVLDESNNLQYYDTTTRTIYSDPSDGLIVLAEPIRDASGYILDSFIAANTDVSGYYVLDPAGATLGALYPWEDYTATDPNAIHWRLLFYSPYPTTAKTGVTPTPRLTFEEEYWRYREPALEAAAQAATDASGLRTIILPLFEAWPIVDAYGNPVPTPDEEYNAAEQDLTGYQAVYAAVGPGGLQEGDFNAFLDANHIYQTYLSNYTNYVRDVSGWMHTYGSVYMDGSANPITEHFTGVTGSDPFYRLNSAYAGNWNSYYPVIDSLNSYILPFRSAINTFNTALDAFRARAPRDTPPNNGISALAYTPRLIAYLPSNTTP